jgi:peptidoglycan/LPS O-acetylase OafA/YrhL
MGRLVFVDGLRGVGASMVVLYHLGGRTTADWLTHRGYLGVAIFFVLSGFVITLSIGDRTISPGFVWRFAARRAVRLDPLYWSSIALAIALAVLATRLGHSQPLPDLGVIASHLFYLQDLRELSPISSVYWTLCLEVQFYLFLLLLLWVKERAPRAFPPLMIVCIVLSLVEHGNLVDLTAPGVFLPYWAAFGMGAMLALISKGQLHLSILAVSIGLVLAFTAFDHADWLIASVLTTVAIYLAWRLDAMGTWLSGTVAQFLGRISYSLYLLHPLIGWTAMSFALQFVNQWYALLIGLFASVLSGWIAYELVERQSVKLSRRIPLESPVLKASLS